MGWFITYAFYGAEPTTSSTSSNKCYLRVALLVQSFSYLQIVNNIKLTEITQYYISKTMGSKS